MIRFCRTTICLLTLLGTLSLWAKGDMVLVEIMGGQFPSTIKITDSKIDEFNIWAGPGVNGVSLEEAEGFIINWKAGVTAAPGPALEHYQVLRRVPYDSRRSEMSRGETASRIRRALRLRSQGEARFCLSPAHQRALG